MPSLEPGCQQSHEYKKTELTITSTHLVIVRTDQTCSTAAPNHLTIVHTDRTCSTAAPNHLSIVRIDRTCSTAAPNPHIRVCRKLHNTDHAPCSLLTSMLMFYPSTQGSGVLGVYTCCVALLHISPCLFVNKVSVNSNFPGNEVKGTQLYYM